MHWSKNDRNVLAFATGEEQTWRDAIRGVESILFSLHESFCRHLTRTYSYYTLLQQKNQIAVLHSFSFPCLCLSYCFVSQIAVICSIQTHAHAHIGYTYMYTTSVTYTDMYRYSDISHTYNMYMCETLVVARNIRKTKGIADLSCLFGFLAFDFSPSIFGHLFSSHFFLSFSIWTTWSH